MSAAHHNNALASRLFGDKTAEAANPIQTALPFLLACCPTLHVLVYHLCGWMLRERMHAALATCYPLALACFVVITLLTLLRRRSWGTRLLALNLLWLVLTQWIGGEDLASGDGMCCWTLMFCGLFAASAFLRPRERRWLLVLVTLLLTVMLFVWAAAAIVTVLRGRSISRLPGIAVGYEDNVPPLVFIRFGDLHRNISSTFFVMATGLLVYWWLGCESGAWQRRFWGAATVVFLPFAFCAVALLRCRSVYLAFSFVTVCTVALLVWRRRHSPVGRRQLLVVLLVGAAMTALLYVSLGMCANVLLRQSQATIESEQAAARAQAEGADQPVQADGSQDNGSQGAAPEPTPVRRGTTWNTFTLAGRTTIWREVIPVLLAHPRIALVGQPASTAMDVVNARITWPYGLEHPEFAHMHNMFLQQLMVAGIPGLLLQVLFVLSLARDCVRCWRRRATRPFQTLLMLAATLVAMLCYGMLEPLLVAAPPASILFYLVAGYFAAEVCEGVS